MCLGDKRSLFVWSMRPLDPFIPKPVDSWTCVSTLYWTKSLLKSTLPVHRLGSCPKQTFVPRGGHNSSSSYYRAGMAWSLHQGSWINPWELWLRTQPIHRDDLWQCVPCLRFGKCAIDELGSLLPPCPIHNPPCQIGQNLPLLLITRTVTL